MSTTNKSSENHNMPRKTVRDNKGISGISETQQYILISLIGRKLYGLEIIKAIEEASEGQKKLSVGTLYPALHQLEQYGYIVSEMQDTSSTPKIGARRKYYEITKEGRQVINGIEATREKLYRWYPV
jgi:DNA-binding PadR family transcriptional regulator